MASPSIQLGFSKSIAGAHASRSMMYVEMRTLVQTVSGAATKADFAKAVVADNVLGKPTLASRKKSLYHLVELYGMDPSRALFRLLWSLARVDIESLPQLCLVCAYARDPQLRQSFELIRTLGVGASLERATMERHLEAGFPGRFSPATKSSLARNVNTTWTFGGHLVGKAKKRRRLPEPRPVSAAYAMLVGYLGNLRGERLLDSAYGALVAANRFQLQSALALASVRGLLSLKQAAGVVEFDFSALLTPTEQALLHESY